MGGRFASKVSTASVSKGSASGSSSGGAAPGGVDPECWRLRLHHAQLASALAYKSGSLNVRYEPKKSATKSWNDILHVIVAKRKGVGAQFPLDFPRNGRGSDKEHAPTKRHAHTRTRAHTHTRTDAHITRSSWRPTAPLS